jgi:hypothetical protein
MDKVEFVAAIRSEVRDSVIESIRLNTSYFRYTQY